MALRYFLYCLFSLCVFVGFNSCSKDLDNPGDGNPDPDPDPNPQLYQQLVSYTPIKLDRIKIRPNHRGGPNMLNFGNYSDLYLTIWIPENAPQPFPTVIYSHGGGSRFTPGESGVEWAKALSTAGYAVIAMHHMIRSNEDVILNICGILDVEPDDCEISVYTPYYESTDRPKDAASVLDNLESIGNMVGYEFDKAKVGVMGFSDGTNTTHYLAGGERDALYGVSEDPVYFSISESRPKAYLAMSPSPGIEGGWTHTSLEDINKPFLCATGFGDLSSELRALFYEQMNSSDQYRVYLNSTSSQHATFNLEFAGSSEEMENQSAFHSWLKSAGIAFLDAYVKEDDDAKMWLRSDNLPEVIHEMLSESDDNSTWSYR